MATPLKMAMSRFVGWLADRKVPRGMRGFVYRGYAKVTGADIDESRGPLEIYPSLGAFFIRELIPGARTIEQDPELIPSPVDGTFQSICPISEGSIIQAKGRDYPVRELLAGIGEDVELEGGHAWTVYLSPRDYHRIHCPEKARLTAARWVPGARHSVAPKVLERRQVLSVNERAVLRLETERGPLFLVLVGALNVGRIRVVGVPPSDDAPLGGGKEFERGGELARFEMGSTIVLVSPPGGLEPVDGTAEKQSLKMGDAIARWQKKP